MVLFRFVRIHPNPFLLGYRQGVGNTSRDAARGGSRGQPCPLSPQELRDLRLRPEEAGAACSEEDIAAWRTCANSWVNGHADAVAIPHRTRWFRLATQDYLFAMDNALLQMTSFGLDNFVHKPGANDLTLPESEQRGLRQPVLSIACDQGPIGFSAYFYKVHHMKIHAILLPDPSHGVWNDVRNALTKMGWYGSVVVLTFLQNMHFGPWLGQKFWNELQDGCKEAMAHSGSTPDEIFKTLVPHILNDKGDIARMSETDIAQSLWDNLADDPCWENKGEKISLSRWFQFVASSARFDESWHTRLW